MESPLSSLGTETAFLPRSLLSQPLGRSFPLESASASEDARHRVVPFVTCRLENQVCLVVPLRQGYLNRPGSRERRRILDGSPVEDHVARGPREVLDQMEVLAGS